MMKKTFAVLILLTLVGSCSLEDYAEPLDSSTSEVPTTRQVADTAAPWWPDGYRKISSRNESLDEFRVYKIDDGFAEFVALGSPKPLQCQREGKSGICIDSVYISRTGCQSGIVSIRMWTAYGSFFIDYTNDVSSSPVVPLEPFTVSHFLPDPSGTKISRSGKVVEINNFVLDFPELTWLTC